MTAPHQPPDEPDADLRALVDDAVSDIHPRPALDRIQARTKATPMSSKRPWIYAAAGAVAATAITVVGVNLLSDDEPTRTTTEPATSATPSPTAAPSETPSESPAPSESTPATPTEARTLPVYYTGETSVGPRLFREFHQLQAEDTLAGQVRAALNESLSATPIDPDYVSGWPQGVTVADVSTADEQITVDLVGAPADRPSSMSVIGAEIALQQLVHTAQAVAQDRIPVLVRRDGEISATVLGVPTSEPLTAAPAIDVQAPVWITSPQDGDVVGRTVEVEGRGAFFEATVSWQLLRDGDVVDEGFTTAEEGMTLSPFSFTFEAEPGGYVLRVYEASMAGGEEGDEGEGFAEPEDTKQIIVR